MKQKYRKWDWWLRKCLVKLSEREGGKMKTFDKKDLYSWSNCEDARSYIGSLGLFSNSLEDLSSGTQNILELSSIDVSSATCFKSEGSTVSYAFFVPWSKVIDLDDCVRIPRYFANMLPMLCANAIGNINYRIYNYGYYESRGSDINNLELANQFKRYLNGELKNNDE